ncbi:hypothetical protein M569_14311, partial [Genlisea aurea]
PPRLSEEINSACSTPFVSAPSSPTNAPYGYFFSAPASPMHYLLTKEKPKSPAMHREPVFQSSDSGSFEFEFSSRFSPTGKSGTGSMTSADELFFNGQIRPMKLSVHLQRSQEVAETYGEEGQAAAGARGRDPLRRCKYPRRQTRSMSPFRAGPTTCEWRESEKADPPAIAANATSSSSSRSSSSARNSNNKWMFLKELLRRSKSEGTATACNKEKLWPATSFSRSSSSSSSRDDKRPKPEAITKGRNSSANSVWRRRHRIPPPSAHELHYTANRAQAEEMRKKTFLPYRQGLLACLGFSSKSYGSFTGFTKTINPISSR